MSGYAFIALALLLSLAGAGLFTYALAQAAGDGKWAAAGIAALDAILCAVVAWLAGLALYEERRLRRFRGGR